MHTGNHKHGLQRCRGHAAAVARAAVWAAMGLATAYFGRAQQTATSTPLPVTVAPITGGTLHGVIKDGAVPLPGVTVTATNTLTGKRYATTSDITGAWSMRIPSNGRYVLRTEFTAFAASTHEVLLNAASHERAVDFDLQLASRVAQLERAQQAQAGNADASQIAQAVRQLAASGPASLALLNSLGSGTEAAEGGATASGVTTPGAASQGDHTAPLSSAPSPLGGMSSN